MGWIWKTLKGFVDPRAAGESIIEKQVEVYRQSQQLNPSAEPHYFLMLVYLSRMVIHGKNPKHPLMQAEALAKTCEYACLPFPNNVRALGISLVQFVRPDVMQQCPDFEREYSDLMAPVHEARQRGQFDNLYRKYNPTMAVSMTQSE